MSRHFKTHRIKKQSLVVGAPSHVKPPDTPTTAGREPVSVTAVVGVVRSPARSLHQQL